MRFKSSTLIFYICLWVLTIGHSVAEDDRSLPWEGAGLKLVESKDLSLEQLHIILASNRVEVTYVIKNTFSKDVTTQVNFEVPSFPYKSLGGQVYWDDELLEEVLANHARTNSWTLERPKSQSIPFHNVNITVNNKKVNLSRADRAKRCGTSHNCKSDVTETLRHHGLPLSPIVSSCFPMGKIVYQGGVCEKRLAILKKLNLVDRNNEPLWTKEVSYVWKQRFKAGQEVTIQHTYRPATGFFTLRFDDERPPLESFAIGILNSDGLLSDCCYNHKIGIDSDLIQWIVQKFAHDLGHPQDNKGAYIYTVDYNLPALKAWTKNEPIKQFRLTIEHPKGGTIQTCPQWTSMRLNRTNETQVSAETKNFIPQNKIRVIFSSPTFLTDLP